MKWSMRSGGSYVALFLICSCFTGTSTAGERIGLVLGGGGARGAAHIGVLKVLERERIPIHAIAGTSVGAIIGGMYASGHSPEEIEKFVTSIDWVDIFRDSTARADLPMRQKETDLGILANLEIGIDDKKLTYPTTLVRGQKLGLLLRKEFLGRSQLQSFDDLPIPFRCVATDIGNVRPVVFDAGDLELAIRSSMAVPGAFAPVQHQGKLLVDGGIVDNLPIDVVRQMGVDRIIVVDVGAPLEPAEEVNTTFEVLLQMVSGMMRDRTESSLRSMQPGDVLLRPDLGELTSAGFLAVPSGIAPGEAAAVAELAKLRELSVSESEYTAWRASQRQDPPRNPTIEYVRVADDSSATAKFVRDRISAEAGKPLDVDQLEKDIGGAFGRGTYESIAYHVGERDGESGLEVKPVDSSLGRLLFRLGMQISDDFEGQDDYQLNIESRVTDLSAKGAEWRSFIGIGRVSAFSTDLYVPFGHRGNWFADPGVTYTSFNQPVVLRDLFELPLADYRVKSLYGEVRVGRDFGDRLRLSTAAFRGHDHAEMRIGDPNLPRDIGVELGGLNVNLLWDTLDNVRFPRHGMRAEFSYSSYDEHFGSDENGNVLRAAVDKPMSFGRNTVMLGARANYSRDLVNAYQAEASLGGLGFLSGLGDRELVDNQQLLMRAIYYRRITEQGLVFDVPMYLGGSLEGGNVWEDHEDVSLNDLIGAASVFLGVDLPFGPLQLGYGQTFDGSQTFYLTFGSLVLPRYR
jgi:NTE family protein